MAKTETSVRLTKPQLEVLIRLAGDAHYEHDEAEAWSEALHKLRTALGRLNYQPKRP
jgi:hypothetical protein